MGLTRESYIGMSQPISGCPLRIPNMLRSREVAGNCWAAHVQVYLMGGLGGTHKWFLNCEDMMASNFGVELRSHDAFEKKKNDRLLLTFSRVLHKNVVK